MSDTITCVRCASEQLSEGSLHSTGRMSFRVDKARFLAPGTANLAVRARMCLDCGHIELVGDVAKARSLTVAA